MQLLIRDCSGINMIEAIDADALGGPEVFVAFLGKVDAKPRDPDFLQKAAAAFAANEIYSEFDLMGTDAQELVLSTITFSALFYTWLQPFGVARWTWPLSWRKRFHAQGRRSCMQKVLNSSVLACVLYQRALLVTRMAAVVGAASVQMAVLPPVERTDRGAMKALIAEIRKEEITIHVDIEAKMAVSLLVHVSCDAHSFSLCEDINLAGLSTICQPTSGPTDKLASLKAKAVKAKIPFPFPYIDVAEFCPGAMQEARVLILPHLGIVFDPFCR